MRISTSPAHERSRAATDRRCPHRRPPRRPLPSPDPNFSWRGVITRATSSGQPVPPSEVPRRPSRAAGLGVGRAVVRIIPDPVRARAHRASVDSAAPAAAVISRQLARPLSRSATMTCWSRVVVPVPVARRGRAGGPWAGRGPSLAGAGPYEPKACTAALNRSVWPELNDGVLRSKGRCGGVTLARERRPAWAADRRLTVTILEEEARTHRIAPSLNL